MAASRFASLAAMAAAAAASTTTYSYADAPSYRFNPFAQSPTPSQSPQSGSEPSNTEPKPEVEDSKGGFDPEALERGAKALREINSNPYSKQVNVVQMFLLLIVVIFYQWCKFCICIIG